MSIQGDIITEMYEEKIVEFRDKLKVDRDNSEDIDRWIMIDAIIQEYEKHFKNFGIYGQ